MSKYDKLTKEELLKLIEQQEKKLKTKKYGLVWDKEKKPEKVVLECENNIPILQRIKEKEIQTDDSEDNILIEGDNFHALTVLNYTHKEKIDVIYIDPPYNTGKKTEWKYNDDFVDKLDGYRHSKWLNFMDKRLRIAKNLLKDSGVIFISIDDNEIGNIRLLCDSIFGEKNFVNTICQKSRDSMSNDLIISENHNFLLLYAKEKKILFKNRFSFRLKKTDFSSYSNPDNDPLGPWKWGPVDGPGGSKKGNPYYEFLGVTGYWRHSKEDMQKLYDEGKIKATQNNLLKKYYKKDDKGLKAVSTWWDNVGTTTEGTKDLKKILPNNDFNNPKPVRLIKRIINLATNKKGIILDFFAGSGTTGQAVLEVNKEDNGNRKFILCTNNENNICEEVTYPRIQKVIQGYEYNGKDKTLLFEKKITFSSLYKNIKQKEKEEIEDYKLRKEKKLNENIAKIWKEIDKIIEANQDKFDEIEKKFDNNVIKIYGVKNIKGFKEGLGGNLQYFKTDLIPVESIDRISDEKRIELTKKAGQMIAVKENTFEEIELNEWYQIFESKNKKRRTAIYFRENMEEFDTLIDKIKNYQTTLYIFSYGRIDKKMYNYLGDNIRIEDIPEPILEIYKEINLTIKEK